MLELLSSSDGIALPQAILSITAHFSRSLVRLSAVFRIKPHSANLNAIWKVHFLGPISTGISISSSSRLVVCTNSSSSSSRPINWKKVLPSSHYKTLSLGIERINLLAIML